MAYPPASTIYRVLFIAAVFAILVILSTTFYNQPPLDQIANSGKALAETCSKPFHSKCLPSKKKNSWNNFLPSFFSDNPPLPPPPPPPPWACRNPYLMVNPQRITVSHIEGNNYRCCFATNYTALEVLMGGDYVPGKFLPMINLWGERFDDTTYSANVGFIGRFVPNKHSQFREMLGFNVFYDYRQGNLGFYNQIGFGLEILSKRWDFRGNVYVPFGAKRHMKTCVFDDYDGDFFAIEDIIESVSYSFNAEVGWLAVDSQYILLYFAGGPYYISGRKCSEKTRGGEFRFQPQYKDFLALNLMVSHDPLFGTVYQAEVLVHLPLYLLNKKIHRKETCGLTARQIYQQVVRYNVMPIARCHCWTSNF